MCTGSKVKTPDTSVQQAETERQYNASIQFQRQQLDLQRELAREQAEAEQRRHEELLALTRSQEEARVSREVEAAAALRAQQEAAAQRTFQSQTEAATQQRTIAEQLAADQRASQERMESAANAERQAQAAQAAARAAEVSAYNTGRQRLLDQSRTRVNEAFAGFNDEFFNEFKTKFLSYYAPKVSKEFSDADRDLTLKYAGTGNLNSSAAARSFGDLTKARGDAESEVAGQADDNANSLRTDIERQRADALASVFSSGAIGDANLPDGMSASTALGNIGGKLNDITGSIKTRASQISAPRPEALPDALNGFRKALAKVPRPSTSFARSGFYSPSSSSSARVVA